MSSRSQSFSDLVTAATQNELAVKSSEVKDLGYVHRAEGHWNLQMQDVHGKFYCMRSQSSQCGRNSKINQRKKILGTMEMIWINVTIWGNFQQLTPSDRPVHVTPGKTGYRSNNGQSNIQVTGITQSQQLILSSFCTIQPGKYVKTWLTSWIYQATPFLDFVAAHPIKTGTIRMTIELLTRALQLEILFDNCGEEKEGLRVGERRAMASEY